MSPEIPERPHRNPETTGKVEVVSKRSADANDEARKNKRRALSAKEQPEDRRTALAGLVLDNWQEVDGTTSCFGVEVDPQMVPEKLVDLLERIEAEFGFDLIEDGLEPADIGDLLNDQLQADHAEHDAVKDRNTLAHETARTAQKSASKEAYRDLIEAARVSGKPNAEIIAELSQNPQVPEAERVKLAKSAQIIDIASTVPADAEITLVRVDQINLSNGVPDPVGFARAFVFDNPGSALPSGVSDATQDAVAEVLGIERPKPSVKTGGDMNEIFEKGVGTKTVRDPNTGELREEPVFLQPGEFEPIREGQSIGLTDRGEHALKFDMSVGGFIAPLPKNASDADMAIYGLAGQWLSRLHDVNMAEIFFPGRSSFERGGGTLDMRMPDDFNRAQRLCQIFFGGVKGYDGELLDQSDLDGIPYLMQFQNAKGDAVIGDINPEQMLADYRHQGLIDKSGSLDWDSFAEMIEANRSRLWTGEQNFAKA